MNDVIFAKHHTGAIFKVESVGDDGVVTLVTNSRGKRFDEYRSKILMLSDDPAWFMNNYVGEVKPGVPVLSIVQCVTDEPETPVPNWSHSNGLIGPARVSILKGRLCESKLYGQVYWTRNDAVVLSADRLFPIFPNRFVGLEVGEVRQDYVLRLLDGTLQFTSLDLLHRFGRAGDRFLEDVGNDDEREIYYHIVNETTTRQIEYVGGQFPVYTVKKVINYTLNKAEGEPNQVKTVTNPFEVLRNYLPRK